MVKIFPYRDCLYAFDSKSNLLTELTVNDIKKLLDACNSNACKKQDLYEYHALFRNGAFLPEGLNKITFNKEEIDQEVEFDLNNVVPRKFILEVTQNCTLKCCYCYFSEDNSNRTHSVDIMSKDTAKSAIDLYFKTYSDSIKNLESEKRRKIIKIAVPTISWWGGEPFLNFELIKWSKKYFESLPWNELDIKQKDLVYSVVTNFTVLDDEILNFLVDNNVYAFISLDGNREHNDANRVYSNGTGSFDIVKANIELLLEKHPLYCKKFVCLQSVQADNINCDEANKYMRDTFEGRVIRCLFNKQFYWGKKKKEKYSDLIFNSFPYERLFKNLNRLSMTKFTEVLDNNREIYDLLKGILSLEEKLVFENPIGSNSHSCKLSCPIGVDAIFVDAKGQLHMCNKSDYSFPIGNTEVGIDKNKIIKLYESYYMEIESNCKKCWAFGFCKICPANAMVNGKFRVKDNEMCNEIKKDLHHKLFSYIILQYYENTYKNATKYIKEKNIESDFLTFEGVVYKHDSNIN